MIEKIIEILHKREREKGWKDSGVNLLERGGTVGVGRWSEN